MRLYRFYVLYKFIKINILDIFYFKKKVMKTKSLIILFLIISATSFAQITERAKLKTANLMLQGNLPKAGNYGFFIQAGDLSAFLNPDLGANSLLNVKYYKTDNVVYRIGLTASKQSEFVSGTGDVALQSQYSDFKIKYSDRTYIINPGIEYHFSERNLFDIYAGSTAKLGFSRIKNVSELNNSSTNYTHETSSTGSVVYGLDAFVGTQIFIADLPIAIGLEYGLQAIGNGLNRTRVENETAINGKIYNQEYFTADPFAFPNLQNVLPTDKYQDLSARTFDLSNFFRFNLAYYFTR